MGRFLIRPVDVSLLSPPLKLVTIISLVRTLTDWLTRFGKSLKMSKAEVPVEKGWIES